MTTQGDVQRKPSMELREKVHDLPPSAKLVALVLQHNGELTQREISNESLLPERTVRLALENLQEVDAVDSRTSLRDARKRLYSLSLQVDAEND